MSRQHYESLFLSQMCTDVGLYIHMCSFMCTVQEKHVLTQRKLSWKQSGVLWHSDFFKKDSKGISLLYNKNCVWKSGQRDCTMQDLLIGACKNLTCS